MKVAALIVEYNPLHNGHLYQIKAARSLVGPRGTIIAIMSGSFCQRGELACLDKGTRAKLAVELGVDLVLELPALAVLASANYFAKAAISLINSLNCVDYVVVGIESEQPNLLQALAELLSELNPDVSLGKINNPSDFALALKAKLKAGQAYPLALSDLLGSSPYLEQLKAKLNTDCKLDDLNNEITDTLQKANNILALSYLQAKLTLPKPSNAWQFKFLKRQTGPDFNSAHQIRKLIQANTGSISNLLANLLPYLPALSPAKIIQAAQAEALMTEANLAEPLLGELAKTSLLRDKAAKQIDVKRLDATSFDVASLDIKSSSTPTLTNSQISFANRFQIESKQLAKYLSSEAIDMPKLLANELSHKSLTLANCKRKLLLNLLNLPNYSLAELNELTSHAHYLRVLAYSNYPGRALLKRLSQTATCPIIMRFSDFYEKQNYPLSETAFYETADADYRATNYYACLSHNPNALDNKLVLTPIKVKRKKHQ